MILEMNNVCKQYKDKENIITILNDFDLHIEKGDFISIMGKSGVGKSTLLHIIGLLDNQFCGNYSINGEAVSHLKEKEKAYLRNELFGFVMQEFNLVDRLTVLDNILIPLEYSKRSKTMSKKERQNLVKEILERLDLGDKINSRVYDLSGGQKQRVAIARALINSPTIIIADEPTGSLDQETAKEILDILVQINKEQGVTIILVTHDERVASICHKQYVLIDKKLSLV